MEDNGIMLSSIRPLSRFFSQSWSSILLAALVTLTLAPVWGSAQSQAKPGSISAANVPPIVITAVTTTTTAPNTVTVEFSASDMTGDGITSFQFDIFFDPDIIVPTGPNFGCSTTGTITPASYFVLCNVTPADRLRVSVQDFLNTPMTGSGTILKVTFVTAPGADIGDISPLTFVPGSLRVFAAGIGEIPSSSVDGEVRIVGTTAADVVIVGRVLDASGRGLSKVRLVMVGSDGQPRYALTNAFGYYRFTNLDAGSTYVINVQAKRFLYAPKTVTATEDIFDLDFIPGQ